MKMRTRGFGAVGLGLWLALSTPVEAQTVAPGWLPFVGCWEPLAPEGESGLLCFRPSAEGLEVSNVLEGDVTATEVFVADGVPRPVSTDGCDGTESLRFSEDGLRVFTSSTFECEAESRAGTGVMSFITPTQWIDVRSLTVGGEAVAWVQRYSAATAESLADHGVTDPTTLDRTGIRSRRLVASRGITMEDVEEALGELDAQAVKVWVAANETDLDVDASTLLRLADAGVPGDVIDVMVAVSFPERFVVTPEGVPQGIFDEVARDAYRRGVRWGYGTFLYDPFYAPFGFRYGYGPFGYYGFGYVPATVVIVERSPFAGGRMVNGGGYRGPGSSRGSSRGSSGGYGSDGASRSSGGDGSSSPSSGSSGGGRRAQRR